MKKDFILGLSEEGFHKVAYVEWGNKTNINIPIICVHGLTRNSRDFDSLAEHLSFFGRHVFCPDIVGRGDSDWLKYPHHYSFEQYIADMTALIARVGAEQIDWIGTSMGGLIGMILASMPNSPIRRLILNDVGPQIPAKGMARLAKYAGNDPDFESPEEAKMYFKKIYAEFGDLTEEQWDTFTEHSVKKSNDDKYVSKVDHGVKNFAAKSKIAWRAFLHPYKAIEGTLFDINLWDIWRKITCPVLVFRGEHSDILTMPILEKMQQIHPEVEIIEVANTGHAPMLLNQSEHELIHRWLSV